MATRAEKEALSGKAGKDSAGRPIVGPLESALKARASRALNPHQMCHPEPGIVTQTVLAAYGDAAELIDRLICAQGVTRVSTLTDAELAELESLERFIADEVLSANGIETEKVTALTPKFSKLARMIRRQRANAA